MHHCHAIRMCGAVITDKFFAKYNYCDSIGVEHSIVLHSNKIAIDSKVASDCLTGYRSRGTP